MTRLDLLARRTLFHAVALLVLAVGIAMADGPDPLPAWNEGAAKSAIVRFVEKVTDESSPAFVPAAERIAVFDNDGTLWCEQPAYVQAVFLIDRVKALAPQHPEWKEVEPFASALRGDRESLAAAGSKGAATLLAATHTGMTVEEFSKTVSEWIESARHPTTHRRYTEMVYQPMLELLAYLRSRGFKTYIVSGGGIEFMRPWTEKVYGIPPEQVIGSYGKLKYELREGRPDLLKLPEIGLIDDHAGKPVGVQTFIGRRPIAAFGNSDGDREMIEWTTAGTGARFGLLIHHDDAEREWAYDRQSPVGRLDTALDQAATAGWTVVSMKHDWGNIFPPAK